MGVRVGIRVGVRGCIRGYIIGCIRGCILEGVLEWGWCDLVYPQLPHQTHSHGTSTQNHLQS